MIAPVNEPGAITDYVEVLAPNDPRATIGTMIGANVLELRRAPGRGFLDVIIDGRPLRTMIANAADQVSLFADTWYLARYATPLPHWSLGSPTTHGSSRAG